jgi:mRNA-degrading endonuclease toxin of MazEF toxin-antitoxin module
MKPSMIYWVEFPARGGHAQAGRRPAIVMQTEAATAHLSTVLLLPLTTQMDALRFPGTALIEVTPENSLKKPSIALAFQLTVVDKQFIGSYLGTLSEAVFDTVWQALESITVRS